MVCDHRILRGFTPLLHGVALAQGGFVCVRCGAIGDGSRVPDREAPTTYSEGTSWYIHPMIHGREATLLCVGGVKRLAVVVAREAPSRTFPDGRIRVRVWQPNTDRKSMVPGTWSSTSIVAPSDEHGPAPWNHPRLFAATMGATWRIEPPETEHRSRLAD